MLCDPCQNQAFAATRKTGRGRGTNTSRQRAPGTMVPNQRFRIGQFHGLSGSSGPFQSRLVGSFAAVEPTSQLEPWTVVASTSDEQTERAYSPPTRVFAFELMTVLVLFFCSSFFFRAPSLLSLSSVSIIFFLPAGAKDGPVY